MAGILVFAEVIDGAITPTSLELLGAARALSSEGGGDVTAFVAGEEYAQDLIAAGADAVVAGTASYTTAASYLPAIDAALEQSGASIVIVPLSSLGRDLGPALAFHRRAGVAMDCSILKIEGGRLKATRSAYGGNARAEHTFAGDLQIITVKPKQFDALEPDSSRSGSVTTTDAIGETVVKVTGTEKAVSEGVKLEDAEAVISGGRGLGDQTGFNMLEELAGLLGGAVGASRAACDLGWYPPSQQIGLTGKTVSPGLYIAVAISGASQHMAGMSSSKNIVAINKDPDANMVQVARFAVIEDYKKIVPLLIEEIKNLP
ncbi:MAG: electron transfer flavoprotein subunit alpha/FixB family protein [Dehalococcoidia bacterium]